MQSIRQQSKFQKGPRNPTQTANPNEKKIRVIRKCDQTKILSHTDLIFWQKSDRFSRKFKSNGSRYTLSAENSNKWKSQKTDHEPLENSNRRKAQYDAKIKTNDGNHPLNSLNKSM